MLRYREEGAIVAMSSPSSLSIPSHYVFFEGLAVYNRDGGFLMQLIFLGVTYT